MAAVARQLFRLSVVEEPRDEREAPPADPDTGRDAYDTRTPAERVQDGRRWLAALLWMWGLAETGPQ